ncbi:uncharacterized protein B0H18DRAFT_1122702 [Fomitopsis serialis]|uniref:uncharacterized protein n=1 Tax=Fomitopsis serialis TaxID=139415 RepID=UPI002008124D|nr:uncharacterized protein B0H18DRAFT_1122702 [Neoantrodia serialis]KAH9919142.1 hypothetical protein B0H18DRAFT_1122702 [Neoantrodia serialis]
MSLPAVDLNSLVATQYLSAVAVTLTLYERLLVFEKEVELIWRQPWSALPILVLLDMYGRQASMLFIAYVVSGISTNISDSLLAFNRFIATYGLLSTASIQFVLVLRIYGLWDNRRIITIALVGGFVVFYGITVAFAVVSTIQTSATAQYNEVYHACGVPHRPLYLIGAYAGTLAYYIYVMILLVINSLNRPRKRDFEIIKNLYRDGVWTLLVFTVLQLARLMPAIFGGTAQTLLTPLITWALDGILSFRLYLTLKQVEVDARKGWKTVTGSQQVFVFEEVEMDLK